jgi:hypothetical protein
MNKEVEQLTPMQQELLNRADSIFVAMKDAAVAAKDFAMEQLPDIVYQLIMFERAFLTITVFLPFIFIPLFVVMFFKTSNENNEGACILYGFTTLFLFIASFISFISMIANFKSFLMVWFAPKIYLIQYLTELLKKAT